MHSCEFKVCRRKKTIQIFNVQSRLERFYFKFLFRSLVVRCRIIFLWKEPLKLMILSFKCIFPFFLKHNFMECRIWYANQIIPFNKQISSSPDEKKKVNPFISLFDFYIEHKAFYIDWFGYEFLSIYAWCFILSEDSEKYYEFFFSLLFALSWILPIWFGIWIHFIIPHKKSHALYLVPVYGECWMRIMSVIMIYVLFRWIWDTFHWKSFISFCLWDHFSRAPNCLHFLLHFPFLGFWKNHPPPATHLKAEEERATKKKWIIKER